MCRLFCRGVASLTVRVLFPRVVLPAAAAAAIAPPVDKPPMGCTCDAFKLLLSNIPVSVTETALISALSQFGHVVQLGLTPDSAGVSCVP